MVLFLGGWWLSDSVPPVIGDNALSELPGTFVRGSALAAVIVSDDRTGVASVVATVDGEPIEIAGGGVTLDPSRGEGPHVLEVVAKDRRGREARRSWPFITDNVGPALQVARSSRSGAQGRTTLLFVRTSEPVDSVQVNGLGSRRELVRIDGNLWRAQLGISAELAPGVQTMTVSAQDAAGNASQEEVELVIAETDFPRGGLIQLSPAQIEARKNRPGLEEASRRRREAFATDVAGSLVWTGPFAMPVPGAILTSPFGKVRDYSDGGVSRHLGTDYAAPLGTPVAAPADGVAVLAESMSIYGLVVILKHGPEIATSYNHLREMAVQPGDVVKRGDIIGKVGSTGQSTGPHLHWGMHIGGFAVAAEQFLEPGFGAPLPDDFETAAP